MRTEFHDWPASPLGRPIRARFEIAGEIRTTRRAPGVITRVINPSPRAVRGSITKGAKDR